MTAARRLEVLDPRALGAKCDVCPLMKKQPVPSSPPASGEARYVILGEAPGEMEVRLGKPFVGQSGRLLDKLLYDVDLDRREAYVANVLACRPDHDDQIDKARQCCAPRLFRELEALPKKAPIVAMGKWAAKSALGVGGIMKSRGFVWKAPTLTDKQLTTLKLRVKEKAENNKERKARRTARAKLHRQRIAGRVVLPTVHPAFVLRSHVWEPVFRVDMERIAKFIRNDYEIPLEDQKPFVVVDSAKELLKLGKKLGPMIMCDIETTGLRYDECEIRCVGIGDKKLTIVAYPWKRKMAEALSEIFRTRRVGGHNFICFDAPVLRHNGVVIDPATIEDTMMGIHAFASHLPKSLLQVVSIFCDSGPWKAEAKGEGVGEKGAPTQIDKLDPHKLVRYNACLLAGTRVRMADGTTKRVDDLVHQRSTEQVLSMGSDGRVEARSIVGWVQKRVPEQQWVRLRAIGRSAITLTPEHVVYTTRGRVEAVRVKKGDRVLTEERELPKEFLQALLGTIVGDSRLAVSPVFRKRRHLAESFSVGGGHSVRSGLAKYKVRVSNGFLRNGMLVPEHTTKFRGKPSVSRAFQQFSSRQTVQLGELNRLAYDRTGQRRLRVEALEYMGPIGLAWFFADDGFLQKDRGNKKDAIGLSTCCFAPRDLTRALRWFRNKFGQSVWVGKDRVMRFGIDAADKFCKTIAPYLPPPARYKLPRHRSWPAYKKEVEDRFVPSPRSRYGAKVVETYTAPLRRATKEQRYVAETRFCISVEKNCNFFTTGGLVANSDVGLTTLGWHRMQRDLEPERHTYEGDKKIATLCSRMMVTGFPFDRKRCSELDEKLEVRARKLLRRMRDLTCDSSFNPASPHAIRRLLYRKFGAPIVLLTKTGLASTSKTALEQFRGDDSKVGKLADYILRWRSAEKTRGTFLSVYVSRDGKVHAGWRLGPPTGRLCCRSPNLQNTPRYTPDKVTKIVDLCDRVRECYVARTGYVLLYFDLAQAEARLAANLSQDPKFIAACAGDVHAGNAKVIFPDEAAKGYFDGKEAKEGKGKPFRDVAKNSGFAIYYLAGWETVYERLSADGFQVSPADCHAILDAIHGTYTTYYDFVARNVQFVKENGYLRTFQSQRIRWYGPFPDPTQIANYPIQGGIADHMNDRLLKIERRLDKEFHPGDVEIIAQVHDSATLEVRKDLVDDVKAIVSDILAPPIVIDGIPPFRIPTDIKIGDRWSSF